MEYFMMQPDKRLTNMPVIRIPAGFSDIEQSKDKNVPLILYVENIGLSCRYSDYLLRPFPMIGERIQSIMEKYQRDMSFRRLILMDKKTGAQHNYYRIYVPEIVCALESNDEPVLNPDKVKNAKIFQVKQFKEKLFVCLDVAESILRREPEGIWFTPVKVSLTENSG